MRELTKRTLFREVNGRIRGVSDRFGRETRSYHILCECGADLCMERVEVPVAVLGQVQDETDADARFLVAPGHERVGTDQVVLATAGYSIVAVEASRAERAPTGLLTRSPLGAGTQ